MTCMTSYWKLRYSSNYHLLHYSPIILRTSCVRASSAVCTRCRDCIAAR